MRACILSLAGLVLFVGGMSGQGNTLAAAQQPVYPLPEQSGSWHFTSFLEDASLEGHFIFNADFDAGGTVWLATSDGLRRFDGYTWKRFSIDDGLPSNFVRYVLFTRDGRLWVGTDAGVALREGDRFVPWAEQHGLAGPNIRRIVEDPDGTLWFCSDTWLRADLSAGLAAYRAGRWQRYGEADGLPSNYVSDLFVDSQGRRFALTRAGLAQKTEEGWLQPWRQQRLADHDAYVWSMAEAADGTVVAATSRAYFVLKGGTWSRIEKSADANFNNPKLTATRDSTIYTITTYGPRKTFYAWQGNGFESLAESVEAIGGVDFITEAPDGSLWVMGDGILVRWQRTRLEWTAYRHLPPLRFVDAQGQVWLSDDRAAFRHTGTTWEVRPDLRNLVAHDGEGALWTWSGDRLVRHTEQGRKVYDAATTGLASLLGHHRDAAGHLFFHGLDAQGRPRVAHFDGSAWQGVMLDVLQGGVIATSQADPNDGAWYLLYEQGAGAIRLVHVDERGVMRILEPGFTSSERPFLHVGRQGRLWLFGEFGLVEHKPEGWEPMQDFPGGLASAVIDHGDELWVSYRGFIGGHNGLSRYHEGRWTHYDYHVRHVFTGSEAHTFFFTEQDGEGEHVYEVSPRSGSVPVLLSVPVPGIVTGLMQTPEGVLWLEVDDVVLQYRPDGIPPETRLLPKETRVLQDGLLQVAFEGIERFKRRGTGTHTFSWRFDDGPWIGFAPAPTGGLSVAALKTGRHTLTVRARDEGLDVDPTPARLRFTVHAMPLQERVWFWPVLGVVFLVILTLGGISLVSRRKIKYYASRLEDLVERRTVALYESEEKYRRLFDAEQDAIVLFDLTTRRIIDANLAALHLYGYNREAMLARTVYTLFASSSEAAGNVEQIEREMDSPTYVETLNHKKADGTVFPVEISVGMFGLHGRKVVYAVMRDVTERARAEAERERLIDELEARNAELERFTYTVSHDLKTPLVTIKGFLGLIKKDAAEGNTPRVDYDIALISQAADTMARLLDELLELSRVGRLVNPPEAIALTDLAREATNLVAGRLMARGALVEVDASMPVVVGDRVRLREVYQNLLDNAVKFMGTQRVPRIEIGAQQCNGEVVCYVQDNGVGIDPRYHEKVFGLFNRLDAATEGTGIGLTLVRRIVEVHGGRVWVESEGEGHGATFWFTLPLRERVV